MIIGILPLQFLRQPVTGGFEAFAGIPQIFTVGFRVAMAQCLHQFIAAVLNRQFPAQVFHITQI
ncbi:hypothetical protein SDC9_103665 [bioreactor metagenome]|uniref:Uncharacterized protein n=1 Tax=bioreactor metagenome TaxID=1076179 RepID=A0A645AUT1_9ZZZZ